jgi:hypothetical protein
MTDLNKRKNFSAATIKQRLAHAGFQCEGILADGSRCLVKAEPGRFHGDHDNPDGLTGEPTFENCRILCLACHAKKTAIDVAQIAKAKRRETAHLGIKVAPTALSGRTREDKDAARAEKSAGKIQPPGLTEIQRRFGMK